MIKYNSSTSNVVCNELSNFESTVIKTCGDNGDVKCTELDCQNFTLIQSCLHKFTTTNEIGVCGGEGI